METKQFNVDHIDPKYKSDYQKTIDSIMTRTQEFATHDISDDIIERLGMNLQLISLEYKNWFEADEAFDQVYAIGKIIEFIKKSRFEFRNIDFYKKESEKD